LQSQKHLLKVLFQNILPILLQLIYSVAAVFIYLIGSWLFFGEGANSFLYTDANKFLCFIVAFAPPFIYNVRKINSINTISKRKYKIALGCNLFLAIFLYISDKTSV